MLAIVLSGTGAAAAIDLRTRRVPNALTIAVAAAGIALSAASLGRVGLVASVAGFVLGAALMLPGHVLGGTGAGDVKLFASAATLLGPSLTLRAFVITAVAGGLMALVVAARRGRLVNTCGATAALVVSGGANAQEIESPQSDNRFAYAPAIAIGVSLAALGW